MKQQLIYKMRFKIIDVKYPTDPPVVQACQISRAENLFIYTFYFQFRVVLLVVSACGKALLCLGPYRVF